MTQIAKREEGSMMLSLAARWGIDSTELVPVTKATIFKAEAAQVSDHELIAFLMVCSRYDLNPFLKQIHAFKDRRGAIVPIVGVDGWVDLVNREKRYRGVQFKVHEDDQTGKLIAYTCYLHVEGLVVPVEVTERLTECYRNTEPWNKMPHRMLRHKSLIQAGRYAFGYSGIYDEDEARDIVEGKIEAFTVPKSLQEAQEAREGSMEPSPTPPGYHEAEAPLASEQRPDCPGCQVEGMAHLEACPNRPKPMTATEVLDKPEEPTLKDGSREPAGPALSDTEAPATPLLLKEVEKVVKKYGLSFDMTGITAMECRLLLTKRTAKDFEKVIKTIESARGPML